MKMPSVSVVFDRKKSATKTKKGLVQIEILYERKRKWTTANVRLYKDQWNPARWVVNRPDMLELNDMIRKQVMAIEKWLRDRFANGVPFSWDALNDFLSDKSDSGNLADFIESTIKGRNDVRESTKKTHMKLLFILSEYGKLKSFSDLTPEAIMDFDNWLHGRRIRKLDKNGAEVFEKMKQQALFDYHKLLKIYINIAVRKGLMKVNPYVGLRFKRGESEPDRFLTEEELRRVETAVMPNGSTARARDLFLFQCYTGLSYADLAVFDFSKAVPSQTGMIYSGRRIKTGEPFYFVILPKAMSILEKYGMKLPVISIMGYNQNLKKVSEAAGLGKPIASHWARRTAAMIFANHGVRIEVVAKILGHSNTQTTQKFYASITGETVADEMLHCMYPTNEGH